MRTKGRKKYFHERSPRVRERYLRHMKAEIRRKAPKLGGLFHTHDLLHGKNGWIDAWFVGKNGTLYNCTLETTRCAYVDELWNLATDAADMIRPMDYSFDRIPHPESGLTKRKFKDDGEGPQFNGLKRSEWIELVQRLMADAGIVKVFAKVELDYEYSWGVGLHATIDVPDLTVETVNAFIHEFIESGEKPYVSDKPHSFKSNEIERFAPEANFIPFDDSDETESD